MKKKELFLKELEILIKDDAKKDQILNKYNSIITKKMNNGEKINNILEELGSPENIAKKELKLNILNKIKLFFKRLFENILKFIKNIFHKKNIKYEPKIIENSSSKNKYFIVYFILEIFLFIIMFYVSVLFMASLFSVFDGIKIYGIVLILLSFVILDIIGIDFLNKKRNNVCYNSKKFFRYIIILILFISIGIAYTTYSYFKIDYINVPNDKYSLTYKKLEYRLPKKGKMDIYFNSWYDVSYSINYDEDFKNKVKIEIKYNEIFYDLITQNDEGDIYISLAYDERDRLSMYLNNLKENKIYNEKELSRYLIKIYINEEDLNKIDIHN